MPRGGRMDEDVTFDEQVSALTADQSSERLLAVAVLYLQQIHREVRFARFAATLAALAVIAILILLLAGFEIRFKPA
jgi:hypothetical protein